MTSGSSVTDEGDSSQQAVGTAPEVRPGKARRGQGSARLPFAGQIWKPGVSWNEVQPTYPPLRMS